MISSNLSICEVLLQWGDRTSRPFSLGRPLRLESHTTASPADVLLSSRAEDSCLPLPRRTSLRMIFPEVPNLKTQDSPGLTCAGLQTSSAPWDGKKDPSCKRRTSRFKNGFHAAIMFVVPYKEAYSWRQNSLGGWKQYLVCSCFPSAWKVYRSPEEIFFF